jgi:hypothetical protein
MTPEGRCTRCSATQYFSEHEPMTDQSSAAVEEAARLLAAYDANTSSSAAALQAAAPRLIRALLAELSALKAEQQTCRDHGPHPGFHWCPECYQRAYAAGHEAAAKEYQQMREALEKFAGAALTVRQTNTREWMEYFYEQLCEAAQACGEDPNRVVYTRDGFRLTGESQPQGSEKGQR